MKMNVTCLHTMFQQHDGKECRGAGSLQSHHLGLSTDGTPVTAGYKYSNVCVWWVSGSGHQATQLKIKRSSFLGEPISPFQATGNIRSIPRKWKVVKYLLKSNTTSRVCMCEWHFYLMFLHGNYDRGGTTGRSQSPNILVLSLSVIIDNLLSPESFWEIASLSCEQRVSFLFFFGGVSLLPATVIVWHRKKDVMSFQDNLLSVSSHPQTQAKMWLANFNIVPFQVMTAGCLNLPKFQRA